MKQTLINLKEWNHTKYVFWPYEIPLEINNWKISGKYLKIRQLLSNPWVKDKLSRRIRKHFDLSNNENIIPKFVECYGNLEKKQYVYIGKGKGSEMN